MHAALESCRILIEQATLGLDDARGGVRVGGRWSIAEIVEHLDRTYTGTVKGLSRCLEQDAPRISADTLRARARRFLVVTLGWFPTGIEAPRHVVPTGAVALSEVIVRSGAHLREVDDAIARIVERFGRGPVLDHPILGPFTAADWVRFHHVHTRHHCRQITDRRTKLDRCR